MERLQWVIRFAQMDLNTIRPGDWLNLRDDLMMFVGVGSQAWRLTDTGEMTGRITEPPLPEAYPEVKFHELQATVKNILHALLDDREGTIRHPRPGAIRLHKLEMQLLSAGPHAQQPGYNVLWIDGSVWDLFMYALFFLLINESTQKLLRCPECDILFYRIGKQLYCSRTCSNRANVRTWRQREDVKQAESERAHQRYRKKTQPDKPSRVTRRPRTRSTGHAETPRES